MNRFMSFIGLSLLSLSVSAADTWLIAQIDWQKQRDLGLLQSGMLQTLKVKVGDKVKAGQLLAQLDIQALLAQQKAAVAFLEACKAAHKQAQTDWKRTKELHDQVLIAQHEMELVDTQLALAKAELAKAEAKLQQCDESLRQASLKAPFAGVVSALYADVGQALNNNDTIMPVLQLRDESQMQLFVPITTEQAQNLTIGQALEARAGDANIALSVASIRWQQGQYQLRLNSEKPLNNKLIQVKLP